MELRHHKPEGFKIGKNLLGHQVLPSARRDLLLTTLSEVLCPVQFLMTLAVV